MSQERSQSLTSKTKSVRIDDRTLEAHYRGTIASSYERMFPQATVCRQRWRQAARTRPSRSVCRRSRGVGACCHAS
jgi:hypothetical protein